LKHEVTDSPMTQDESQDSIWSFVEGAWTRIGLFVSVFLIGAIILSIFFPIPILIPTPWTTAIYFLYLAPILLYSFSYMVRPLIVLSLCFPA